ncbi:MAG: cytidine deaminase [Candidatus Izemoplasmatales bacterium]|nr:cytidine deaminase [Candidatus Izemoplasmatales bacterium]
MKELIKLAKENMTRAYVPYSHFPVSAVLELKDGRTYKGVNIENAAYGLSNCAERSALFAAYSDGVKKEDIKQILIYTPHDYFVSPCGSCRQVMRELMEENADVVLVNEREETKIIKNVDLLPHGFTKEDL